MIALKSVPTNRTEKTETNETYPTNGQFIFLGIWAPWTIESARENKIASRCKGSIRHDHPFDASRFRGIGATTFQKKLRLHRHSLGAKRPRRSKFASALLGLCWVCPVIVE